MILFVPPTNKFLSHELPSHEFPGTMESIKAFLQTGKKKESDNANNRIFFCSISSIRRRARKCENNIGVTLGCTGLSVSTVLDFGSEI